MQEEEITRTLPENLHKEMLEFFRRTSLPRIQREREQEKLREKNTPSENNR